MTRKVTVYEMLLVQKKIGLGQSLGIRVKTLVGPAIFHQFGIDFEEFEDGPGNFTTAICEMPDGSVRNVPVELVVFDTDE